MKRHAFQGEEHVNQKVYEVQRMGNEIFGEETREAVSFQGESLNEGQ
jgi:hypothetical protein